tara:strand:+ start:277 stop:1158 length:882 start_codon:yes stop_codon:yes gene_type:complete
LSGGEQLLKPDANEITAQLAELFVVSNSASEFCRNIVLNPTIGTCSIGTQLFIVNQDGKLGQLSSFGVAFVPPDQVLSISDDHPVARAIALDQEIKEVVRNPVTGEDAWLYVYPYRRPSNPVGACVMLKSRDYHVVLNPSIQKTLSLMGALWLEAVGIGPSLITKAASDIETITPRQTQVLALIAQQRTNQEIADELFLSESTIKQECVKIFRVLGVATRAAAANKANSFGIVPSRQLQRKGQGQSQSQSQKASSETTPPTQSLNHSINELLTSSNKDQKPLIAASSLTLLSP